MSKFNVDCLVELAERIDQNDVLEFSLISKIFYLSVKRAFRILRTSKISIATSLLKTQNKLMFFPLRKDFQHLCEWAARVDNCEVLKWAYLHNFPLPSSKGLICNIAAENGNFEMLKWARENDCEWNVWTCACAAEKGHLEILKWVRKNGCEWNWTTCAFAAFGNQLETLKWCRNNGAPWDFATFIYAKKYPNIKRWCEENGCPRLVYY